MAGIPLNSVGKREVRILLEFFLVVLRDWPVGTENTVA